MTTLTITRRSVKAKKSVEFFWIYCDNNSKESSECLFKIIQNKHLIYE